MRRRDARRRQRAGGGGRAALIATARVLLATLLAGAAAAAAPPLALPDHPLAGKVWDVAAARFIPAAAAAARIAAADIALLGETHDNTAHHALQARWLRRALASGRRPALALEPLDLAAQAAIDAAAAGPQATPAAVGAAAKVSRGWDWPAYEPLVAIALEHRLPIVAMNLPRTRARALAVAGLAGLGEGEPERLGLTRGWSAAQAAELRRALVAGHCGDASPRIDAMAPIQRARDALMADRLLAAGDRGAVAILGRGHARADIGVPFYLRRRAPGKSVVSVGMVEVKPGALAPSAYAEAAPGRHHLLWFTPRADRADPCAGFPAKPPAAP